MFTFNVHLGSPHGSAMTNTLQVLLQPISTSRFFFATSRLAVAVQPYSPLPGLNLSLERDPAFKFLSSFLFSLFVFSWRIIALQYYVFVKHPHESAIGIHMSPPSWTSLPPPSPAHPTRLSQSPSLGSLRHTANSLWLSVLHMIVYMFPCYSPNSSHLPFLPPLAMLSLFSMAVSPLLLCNYIHQSYFSRFHIYALIYDTCFSQLTSLCIIGSRFIHFISTDSNVFLSMAE